MPTLHQLDEYVHKLAAHDWTYDYSDDYRVWRRGEAAAADLQAIAKTDPVYQEAYQAYSDYKFKTNNDYSKEAWAKRRTELEEKLKKLRESLK